MDRVDEREPSRRHRFFLAALIIVTSLVALGVTYWVLSAASSDSDSDADSTFSAENNPPEEINLLSDVATVSETANVLLIMLDDAGWADFSYNANDPWYKLSTPHMDSIMSDGLYFSNYYTQSICTPTRASLMTGRWTWVLGQQDEIIFSTCMAAHLSKDYPTYAELTREKGYKNYLYGKWHLGMDSWSSTPIGRGFDKYMGNLNSGGIAGGGGSIGQKGGWYSVLPDQNWSCNKTVADSIIVTKTYTECLMRSWEYYYADWNKTSGVCCSWLESSIPETCSNYVNSPSLDFSDSVLEPYGQYIHIPLLEHSIDFWEDLEAANPLINKRQDMFIFDQVELRLESLSKTPDQRWTMMLSLKTPHQDPTYLENGTNTDVYLPCYRYFDEDSKYYNYDRGAICQQLHEVDLRIGELMEILKDLELWDHTLVILTNDNGGTSGQNPWLTGSKTEYNYAINWPLRGVKSSYYQGAVKTILAISGGALPKALAGTENGDLHHVSDIAPTIAAVAGFTDKNFESISNGTPFDGFPLLSTSTANYGQHQHIYLSMPSYTADYTSNNTVIVLANGLKYIGPGGDLDAFGYWGTLPLWHTIASKWENCTEGCVWDLTTDPYEETDIGYIVNQTVFSNLISEAKNSELWNDGISGGMSGCSYCTCCQNCADDNGTIEVEGFHYYFPWL